MGDLGLHARAFQAEGLGLLGEFLVALQALSRAGVQLLGEGAELEVKLGVGLDEQSLGFLSQRNLFLQHGHLGGHLLARVEDTGLRGVDLHNKGECLVRHEHVRQKSGRS